MRLPDRLRPAACAIGVAALLSACGPSAADRARLDKLEQRVGVLEKEVATASPAPSGKTAASAPTPRAPVDVSHYQEGAVATVHAAPTQDRTLAEIPPDSVGGFIYTGDPIALHDLSSRGVRHTGLAGVELQGWLKATQSGRYEFGEDLHGSLGPGSITGAPCLLQVWIEGRSVGSQEATFPWWNGTSTEQRISLLVGADLQPGLYAIRLWTVCAAHNPASARLTADLLLKAPSDLNLRGYKADELLHQP